MIKMITDRLTTIIVAMIVVVAVVWILAAKIPRFGEVVSTAVGSVKRFFAGITSTVVSAFVPADLSPSKERIGVADPAIVRLEEQAYQARAAGGLYRIPSEAERRAYFPWLRPFEPYRPRFGGELAPGQQTTLSEPVVALRSFLWSNVSGRDVRPGFQVPKSDWPENVEGRL